MSKRNIRKKQDRLFQRDPLMYQFRRGKKNKKNVDEVVLSHGGAFGQYAPNWLHAGLLAATIQAIFESNEPQFVEARKKLRAKGIRKYPKPVHFEALAYIEAAFPRMLDRETLAESMNVEQKELGSILTYLRDFSVVMMGVNILRDGKGHVGIADRALWIDFQNRMSRIKDGIDKAQRKHGLSYDNLRRHSIGIQRETLIQPALELGFEDELGLEDGDDHNEDDEAEGGVLA